MANYILSEKEEEAAKAFIEKHKKCRPKYLKYTLSPQYAPFKYIFAPTGIGTAVSIKCPYCDREKDITDVSCW